MDKNTLSNYGWIVIAVLVLSVMIALATPFGTYVGDAVENTTQGIFDVSNDAMNTTFKQFGVEVADQKFDGSGDTNTPQAKQLTTLTPITWKGLTNFEFSRLWNDGTNTYCAKYNETTHIDDYYILNGDTWKKVDIANGIPSLYGEDVWTDGTNIYCSKFRTHYVLDKETSTWIKKAWNNAPTYFSVQYVWTDGTNIYYSNYGEQYVLNGDTWVTKTWTGLTSFTGQFVWTDGTNTYYSGYSKQYILNKATGEWESKTWNNIPENQLGITLTGDRIWTDGTYFYFSNGTTLQYVLNGDTWEPKTWNNAPTYIDAYYIWTDGTNCYYHNGSTHYIFS